MRKLSNVLIALLAAAVCVFMTWLTFTAGWVTVVYNLVFLGIMVFIILLSLIVGFGRMGRTVRGLKRASARLVSAYKNKAEMLEMTRAGARIFEVSYLDRKYQEYLGYLRKTNSPCDIGDYIGEYEINNYTHRRLLEMIPDILTSLGILGTFMGLVWGLRGFNPVSYEAMASSITSLIDGIKVAFVTSIYGITLSMAYSYWLRGSLTNVSENLDNFLDKYYLCAVSPTDATAVNFILANQKEQIRALEGMTGSISDGLAVSMADHMDPMMTQINRTLENFTDIVTGNQQEMLENVAAQVMAAMKKEFISEFAEMRSILKQTNEVQKAYLDYITKAQSQFEKNLQSGMKTLSTSVDDAASSQKASVEDLKQQQKQLREFVDYMSQAMANINSASEESAALLQNITDQAKAMERLSLETAQSAADATESMAKAREAANDAEYPVQRTQITDLDELTDRLDQMIRLLEKQNRQIQQRNNKKGLFK